VDVTIEYYVASYPIVVAVECRDHKRPATVEWIEQLSGKYQNSGVNQIVAVSKSGFVNTALRKAKSRGILALTLDEASDTEWVAYVKSRPPVQLTLAEFSVTDVDLILVDKSLTESDLPPMTGDDVVLVRPNGERIGTVVDIYNQIASSTGFETAYLASPTFRGDGRREIIVTLEEGVHFEDSWGSSYGVEGIAFGVGLKTEEMFLALEAKSYNQVPVAVASARTASWAAQLAETTSGPALSIQSRAGDFGPGIVRLYGLRSPTDV
jgi:hypothetical protein